MQYLGDVILLCNLTDTMAEPWLTSGYRVIMVDPQHPKGVHIKGPLIKIGCTIIETASYLGEFIRKGDVVFVAGFPPCTDVAVSGARWFERKRQSDPYFQAKAAIVAEQCRMIGILSGASWFFENPVSVFSSIFGSPDYIFSPDDYTGYCKDDNYTKTTCLWAGNNFVMPKKFKDSTLGPPDDRIHKCPPSSQRANLRSATPKGFSLAVFLHNAPHIKGTLCL